MEPLPHRYIVALFDGALRAPPREPIAAGTPPQFGGTDRVWSPEELLVGATLGCLWTTFEAYARRDGLVVRHWDGSGVGVLDRGTKTPAFKVIELTVHIEVDAGKEDRARELLAKAEANCIISNALRAPVELKAFVDAYAAAS
jgi:organic hydroperoxide reductase OsmC/OhrA